MAGLFFNNIFEISDSDEDLDYVGDVTTKNENYLGWYYNIILFYLLRT